MLAEGGVYVGGVVDAAVLVGAVAANGGRNFGHRPMTNGPFFVR